jgi:hypothetical protein
LSGRKFTLKEEYIMKKKIMLVVFALLFFFGIVMILKSNSWGWGSYESMNLAGGILAVMSGIGFLCELYICQKK